MTKDVNLSNEKMNKNVVYFYLRNKFVSYENMGPNLRKALIYKYKYKIYLLLKSETSIDWLTLGVVSCWPSTLLHSSNGLFFFGCSPTLL